MVTVHDNNLNKLNKNKLYDQLYEFKECNNEITIMISTEWSKV